MSNSEDTFWTPGPWKVLPRARIDTQKGWMRVQANGLANKEEMQANARLMAQSPEMLEELKDAREDLMAVRHALKRSGIGGVMQGRLGERISSIDNLLEQARGG